VGGRSLLEWHIDLLHGSSIRDVLLVTGHLSDEVNTLVDTTDRRGLNLTVIDEADPRGTMPALAQAADASPSNRFLTILGDIWCSFPIDGFLSAWQGSGESVAAIVHPSLHPADSDAVIPQPDGSVLVVRKNERDAAHRNMSATGIFALTREAIAAFGHHRDIGSDVLPDAASDAELYAHVSSHYFKDTGTPDRLQGAEQDWESSTFSRRGELRPRAALILDRDGVINPALPEIYRPNDMSLLPGVGHAISQANAAGIPVLVATNQPGLAKGFMTPELHEGVRARLDALLVDHGAFIDDYAFCPHHPEFGHQGEVTELKIHCTCRKPEPGLLRDLMTRHDINAHRSLMVGDSDRDEGAARAAEVGFIQVTQEVPAADAIGRAVRELTC
jgi:D-glycero-D-manno-heptose 1,7-bisphosphate phosphatase